MRVGLKLKQDDKIDDLGAGLAIVFEELQAISGKMLKEQELR
jgi:hypothetical protein